MNSLSEASDVGEIVVPQYIGLNALTKIIVGYLKAGGNKAGVRGQDVAQLAGVAANNVLIRFTHTFKPLVIVLSS